MMSLDSIKALALSGKKIKAIKKLKDAYRQLGLKEAKDIVEALEDGSMSIPEAKERLKPYRKLTAAAETEYKSESSLNTPRTLITKNKTDNKKVFLLVVILILLGYIMYLKSQ